MTESPDPRPKRRWLMPLLFVSLALNLMIAGIAVGWALSGQDRDRDRRSPEARELRGTIGEPYFRALPDDKQRDLVRDVISDRDRFRENRNELRSRVQSFLAALRADPFDPEAVAVIMEGQRDVALGRQKLGEELLLKQLSAMSPEERAAYADRMEGLLSRLRRRD